MGLPDFGVGECTMVQLALLEGERQPKCIALIKAHAQHLAVFELYFPKGCLVQLGKAQVASGKGAINEFAVGQIGVGEIALNKGASFVLSYQQGLQFKVNPVEFLIPLVSFANWAFHATAVKIRWWSSGPLTCP